MSIALYWAVSCGAFSEQQAADSGSKGDSETGPAFPHVALQSGATLSEAMKEMIEGNDTRV